MASPKAKKRYGQHFIKDAKLASKIVDTLTLANAQYHDVVEVGPGRGIITQALLDRYREDVRVWGIEVDEHYYHYLQRRFPALEGHLFQGSILDLNLPALLQGRPFALIGNLPYNVASQIILNAVSAKAIVPEIAGTFQLEVGQRLSAAPGNKQYGLLSVMFQSVYHPKLCFRVPPGAFAPPPRVQSVVVRGVRRSILPEDEVPYPWLLAVVKQAFHQRRKKLSNTLKAFYPHVKTFDEKLLDQRPEVLPPETYRWLAIHIGLAEGWPVNAD